MTLATAFIISLLMPSIPLVLGLFRFAIILKKFTGVCWGELVKSFIFFMYIILQMVVGGLIGSGRILPS